MPLIAAPLKATGTKAGAVMKLAQPMRPLAAQRP